MSEEKQELPNAIEWFCVGIFGLVVGLPCILVPVYLGLANVSLFSQISLTFGGVCLLAGLVCFFFSIFVGLRGLLKK